MLRRIGATQFMRLLVAEELMISSAFQGLDFTSISRHFDICRQRWSSPRTLHGERLAG
jgi:hypothetical protein